MQARELIIDLMANGLGRHQIAKDAGITRQAVGRILDDKGTGKVHAETMHGLVKAYYKAYNKARQRLKDSEATLSALQAKEQA